MAEPKSGGSSSSLRLRASNPGGSRSEVFLVDGLTLGRTNANILQVEDDGSGTVERTHARVEFSGDGSVRLRCLHANTTVFGPEGSVSSLILVAGTTFRIGRTKFSVVPNAAEDPFSPRSGLGCPYCGSLDLVASGGKPTPCPSCHQPVLAVPAGADGTPRLLPGNFTDSSGRQYAVERFVARGGMGYVLKGSTQQGAWVAIKILIWNSDTSQQSISRFKQEIELLRRLHDPNVVGLISCGQEAGLFFYVMDWVDGHDLRQELQSPGKPETLVPFSRAVRWFEQACLGLLAIHRAGAVHRDIKPSNLLLTSDGRLLIADLGVAKKMGNDESGMTSTGQMPGTYWYMAPEQHYAPDLVDHRTDIYSLGFTFWELLTGVKPNTVRPAPPSSVNPTVPKAFDTLLFAMLEGKIADRPASMLEILRAIPKPEGKKKPEPVTSPPPGVEPPPGPASQPPKPTEVGPFINGIFGLGFMIFVAVVLYFKIFGEKPAPQGNPAPPIPLPRGLTNSIGMEFASIPAGKFLMGSPVTEKERYQNENQHEVTLTQGFRMGVHEVTQAQYEQVMGKNPSYFKGATLPVETVSYDDAMAFCKKLSDLPVEKAAGRKYRLPTEAEWEYCCRAGTSTPFHFGSELNGTQANCDGNLPYGTTRKGPYLGKTSPVGSYPANLWGLYDMHGNVWEWCQDRYDSYPKQSVADPRGPEVGSGCVFRGGGWSFVAANCRSAIRSGYVPSYRDDWGGFRLALSSSGIPK